MADEAWANLDEVLAQARNTLKDVQIYAHTANNWGVPRDLALLRTRLPSVAPKISVYPTEV
jgi:hypothetical protein